MKRILPIFAALIMLSTLFTSCNPVTVDEGHQGLIVKRPYIFGSDETEVVNPGRHYLALSSDMVPINIQNQKFSESFDDLNTKDNVPVDFDIHLTIQINRDEIDKLYSNFGMKFYDQNIKAKFRNLTRDKCKTYDMGPLTNDANVSNSTEAFVKDELQKYFEEIKLPVTIVDVNMGSVNPPSEVLAERSKTASSKQREKTIAQETANEVLRIQKEEKRAEADMAYQKKMGLNSTQFIELRELEVKEKAYTKAGTVILNEGSNMMMQVK